LGVGQRGVRAPILDLEAQQPREHRGGLLNQSHEVVLTNHGRQLPTDHHHRQPKLWSEDRFGKRPRLGGRRRRPSSTAPAVQPRTSEGKAEQLLNHRDTKNTETAFLWLFL